MDLELNYVSTLISTGSKTKIGDEEVVLKSPWDLVFYESGTLIIAAAGNHRLFGYFFQTTTLFGIEYVLTTSFKNLANRQRTCKYEILINHIMFYIAFV